MQSIPPTTNEVCTIQYNKHLRKRVNEYVPYIIIYMIRFRDGVC